MLLTLVGPPRPHSSAMRLAPPASEVDTPLLPTACLAIVGGAAQLAPRGLRLASLPRLAHEAGRALARGRQPRLRCRCHVPLLVRRPRPPPAPVKWRRVPQEPPVSPLAVLGALMRGADAARVRV